jgi:2,3-bisphosphoglycerate-independent phosphoglycerate mutase
MSNKKPVMLCILDGWGDRESTADNAISVANTPNWDRMVKEYPTSLVETSGLDVGLPDGQMGNSEVGHMNIGAGRVVMQDLPRITVAIKENTIASNPELVNLINTLKETGNTCHIMGLMSPGGVHSHQDHFVALCKILNENSINSKVHAFLDGRDTAPKSGQGFVSEFEKSILDMEKVSIATVSGRFYAMDRDKRWDRVEKAYNAIVKAEGEKACCADKLIANSYLNDVTDEFVIPSVVEGYEGIKDGDAVLMVNYRADRAREILYAICDDKFDGFERRNKPQTSINLGMTEYSVDHGRFMNTLFPPQALENILGKVVADNGMKQLRIAETEKYAHVTFFFNGGEEAEFGGEDRILIPSPKVATYDLKPEMSAPEVTEKLVKAIEAEKYDVIICNYANGDMVGHTGVMDAAIKAVETVDNSIGEVEAAIIKVGGVMIVTADHGNCEKMIDEKTGEPYTAHTVGKVPAVLVNGNDNIVGLKDGKLADLAPTLLDLLNVDQPEEMTGSSMLLRK